MDSFYAKEAAEAINAQLIGNEHAVCKNVCINSKEVEGGSLFVAMKGARVDGHDFIPSVLADGATVVLSEKLFPIPSGAALLLVADTRLALGKLAKWYQTKLQAKMIGVTGSVGKTSTKEFIYAVLKQNGNAYKTQGNFNNEIGLPLTILGMDKTCDYGVIEMGMSGFDEIAYLSDIVRPSIGVVTNIGVAHIEKLGSRENILKAKFDEMCSGMDTGGVLVLNGDEPLLYEKKDNKGFQILYFGIENEKCDLFATDIVLSKDTMTFKMNGLLDMEVTIPTVGRHNISNALCAALVGVKLGLSSDEIRRGLMQFQNASKRQNIFEEDGILFIDDTYNSSPDSMRAAIAVLAGMQNTGKKIVVMGDMLELGAYTKTAHEDIGRYIADMGIDVCICKGTSVEFTNAVVSDTIDEIGVYQDDEAILHHLQCVATPGDAILFKGSRGMKMENILRLWKVGEYRHE